jgi:NAD(P)-dependent dehydrogenase (short-subunit alcohol dehydrogenase family)
VAFSSKKRFFFSSFFPSTSSTSIVIPRSSSFILSLDYQRTRTYKTYTPHPNRQSTKSKPVEISIMSENVNEAGHSVKNKIVLITGANRGIGKKLVDECIRQGSAKVYAAVRTLSSAQPLVDQYENVHAIYMDLSKPETIEKAALEANDVQIVINNAGILSHTDPLSPNAVQQLEQEMQVNVYGFMHVAQQFAPLLKQNNDASGGVLVQINSVASFRCAVPSVATYSASKAAAFSVTQALRSSLKAQGTMVLSVHPGPIATDMIKGGFLANLQAESPTVVAEEVVQAIESGGFLVFPDPQSKSLGKAYSSFAQYVFEDGKMY